MKKYISSFVLSIMLALAFSMSASAATSVSAPSFFTLKIGESVFVTNYLSTTITLKDIQSMTTMSYPSKTYSTAKISVTMPGGCGPNTPTSNTFTPECLGMPGFSSDYDISAGNSASVLGLIIKATAVTSTSASFAISLKDSDTSQCMQRPPCLDANPKCMIAEPAEGWCQIPLPMPEPIPDGTGSGGGSSGSGGITICSNGGSDCSITTFTGTGGAETSTPAVTVNLSEGEYAQSVVKTETEENMPAQYTVQTEREARLFFIIPVRVNIMYSVNAQTGEKTVVQKPWWNFLAW